MLNIGIIKLQDIVQKTSRPKLIMFAVTTYVLAVVAFILLWYFLVVNASAMTRTISEVASIARPSGGF